MSKRHQKNALFFVTSQQITSSSLSSFKERTPTFGIDENGAFAGERKKIYDTFYRCPRDFPPQMTIKNAEIALKQFSFVNENRKSCDW